MQLNHRQRYLFIAALATKHTALGCEQQLARALYPDDPTAGEFVRERLEAFFNGPDRDGCELEMLTNTDLLGILNEKAD